jgi:hypothetical protein
MKSQKVKVNDWKMTCMITCRIICFRYVPNRTNYKVCNIWNQLGLYFHYGFLFLLFSLCNQDDSHNMKLDLEAWNNFPWRTSIVYGIKGVHVHIPITSTYKCNACDPCVHKWQNFSQLSSNHWSKFDQHYKWRRWESTSNTWNPCCMRLDTIIGDIQY